MCVDGQMIPSHKMVRTGPGRDLKPELFVHEVGMLSQHRDGGF